MLLATKSSPRSSVFDNYGLWRMTRAISAVAELLFNLTALLTFDARSTFLCYCNNCNSLYVECWPGITPAVTTHFINLSHAVYALAQ